MRDQRGSTLVLTAVFLMVMVLFAGLVLDLGRGHLLRAQLQTALDAAALAGALVTDPYYHASSIRVFRVQWYRYWVDDYCYDPALGWYPCGGHWEYATRQAPDWCCPKGYDRDLFGGDRPYWSQPQCQYPYVCTGYRYEERWASRLQHPAAEETAREVFLANVAILPRGPAAPVLQDFEVVAEDRPDPYHNATVLAWARMGMPTEFLRLVGLGELQVYRAAEAQPTWGGSLR